MPRRGSNFDVAIGHVLARQLGEPDLLTDGQWDEFFGRAKKVAYSAFI